MFRLLTYRFIIVLLVVFLGFAGQRRANAQVIDRVVAVVNDDIITLSELEAAGSVLLESMEKNPKDDDLKKKALKMLIDDKLVEQAAERGGLTATEREIDNAIEDVKKRNNIDQETLLMTLKDSGISYSDYREKLKRDITQVKLINREVRAKISMDDDEVAEFYKKNREKFALPLEVRLRLILLPVPPSASDEERKKARTQGEKLLKRLKKGGDFALIASRFSRGPNAENGGDIGYIKKGDIDPVLEEVAFGLNPGEFSDLVSTSLGFVIVKVVDKKGGGITPFKDVEEKVKDLLMKKKEEEAFNDLIEDMRKKSYIDVRL